ncbi:hypothetical protein [Cytobacillus gottheilii]|uniref:hypothetical protein n=1 Tax=Cytobacillus gottheilii TaxID=859144 RepID=UPI0009BBDF39|nr:hypothetical protein [Cytobacillus gottheilii]
MGLFSKLFGANKEALPEQTNVKKDTDDTISIYVVYKNFEDTEEDLQNHYAVEDEIWTYSSLGESSPISEYWAKEQNLPIPLDNKYPYFLLYHDLGKSKDKKPIFQSSSKEEVMQFLEKYESGE